MTKTDLDALVADYLRQLDTALARRHVADREQLVSEIRDHLDQARSQLPTATEVNLRDLLDRMGTPDDIAQEAARNQSSPPRRHTRRQLILAVVALVLIALGISLGVTVPSNGTGSHPTATTVTPSSTPSPGPVNTVVLPKVVGDSQAVAAEVLSTIGLATTAQTVASDTVPSGVVISSNPAAGSTVPFGGTVHLVISAGPDPGSG